MGRGSVERGSWGYLFMALKDLPDPWILGGQQNMAGWLTLASAWNNQTKGVVGRTFAYAVAFLGWQSNTPTPFGPYPGKVWKDKKCSRHQQGAVVLRGCPGGKDSWGHGW